MNIEQLEGKWAQIKGQIKEKWGKLTDDDITVIHGKSEQMIGKLRERYGYGKDEAERKLSAFLKECTPTGSPKASGCATPPPAQSRL